jgi:hypothetical protein
MYSTYYKSSLFAIRRNLEAWRIPQCLFCALNSLPFRGGQGPDAKDPEIWDLQGEVIQQHASRVAVRHYFCQPTTPPSYYSISSPFCAATRFLPSSATQWLSPAPHSEPLGRLCPFSSPDDWHSPRPSAGIPRKHPAAPSRNSRSAPSWAASSSSATPRMADQR